MDTQEKVKTKYLNDKVANLIFSDKDCRDYLISVVSAALDIDKEFIRNNLELVSTRVNNNINTKYNYADNVYENDFSIINIEVNYNKQNITDYKNMRYICHLILRQTKSSEKYKKLKPIYQININNYDVFNENKFIYKSVLMEESLHKRRNDFFTIIDINVDFLASMDYNIIRKEKSDTLEKLLYIFICDNKEVLDELYVGDRVMDEMRKKIDNVMKDFDALLYYDYDEYINQCSYEKGFDEGVEQGKEEGLKEGIAKGTDSTKIEIAKSMLKEDIPLNSIIKITGLTKEEIDNLNKES